MDDTINAIMDDLLRENSEEKKAHRALIGHGMTDDEAQSEIAKVLLGCLWEAWRGAPDRFGVCLEALQRGRTAEELFPDAIRRIRLREAMPPNGLRGS